jgi:PilZ domain
MPVQSERRNNLRKRPLGLVYVELTSANGGMMRDLSENGFAMRVMVPLRAADITPFRFSLDGTTPIEGGAFVQWVEEGGRLAGLEFTEISQDSRELIRKWLASPGDSSSRQAEAPKDSSANATSLAELREEIRTAPPRPAVLPVIPPSRPPIESNVNPQLVAEPEPAAAPELPASSETHVAPPPIIEIAFEPQQETSIAEKLFPAPESVNIAAAPPASPETEAPSVPGAWPDPSSLEPLPAVDEEGWEAKGIKWLEQFTLTHVISIMLVLTIFAGSIVYHREVGHLLIWLGEKIAGPPDAQSSRSPLGKTSASSLPAPATLLPDGSNPAAASPEGSSSVSPSLANQSSDTPSSSSAVDSSVQLPLTPATKTTIFTTPSLPGSAAAKSSAQVNTDSGQSEYLQALQILRGNNRAAQMSEAIRLLWVAVEKGNSNAEIALADLYWRGQDVAGNCAQARILLSTAARKGNTEAQNRLAQFQRDGCEE